MKRLFVMLAMLAAALVATATYMKVECTPDGGGGC